MGIGCGDTREGVKGCMPENPKKQKYSLSTPGVSLTVLIERHLGRSPWIASVLRT